MNIEINPKLIEQLNTTATGQGLTPERFAERLIEKHLISNLRTRTSEILQGMSIDDIKTVKASVEALAEARLAPVIVE